MQPKNCVQCGSKLKPRYYVVKERGYCEDCFDQLKGVGLYTIVVPRERIKVRAKNLAKSDTSLDSKEGRAFLAANKCREGVRVTESGLQYKVLSRGIGTQTPTESDRVTVNYRGSLIDGMEFGSTAKRDLASTFEIDSIIPGLAEALQLMKVGDKFEVSIPAHLAYGVISPEPSIGANSVLIFEVELIAIDINPPQVPS